MKEVQVLINIIDKVECCGCAACANICPKNCIKMESDNQGFLYPKVEVNVCVGCGLCEKACPILNHIPKKENESQIAAIVQHKNKEICHESTAGGAFTAIAEYVIDHNGIVFGVEMSKDYFIHHTSVENKKDLIKFRNSKYVQSAVGNTYVQVKKNLDAGRMVCFSGTPCQIEGLHHYLGKDYEKLVLVDVVCRAVPSPGVWKKYIDMETCKYGDMSSIRFRDKTLGYQYSTMELKNTNGKILRGGIESQPWLRMFFSGMIIRPSCTKCRFRSQYRKSDFTIWDCFNIYQIDKDFNENVGATRILIHSGKGKDIFEKIKENLKYKVIPVEIAVNGVQEMIVSPIEDSRKEEFFRDEKNMAMEDLLNKYFPETVKVKLKKNVRIFLNRLGLDIVLKHILKKE